MSIDKKMAELEKLAKEMEGSTSFDKTIENFTKASALVKEILGETADKKGRVLEIIKDVDGMIEREVKQECDDEGE